MKEFPLTFQTVHQGNEIAREVANRDELIALRSELELLILSRAGQGRLACIALSNSEAFEDPRAPEEFHNILVDALHPRVAKTIEEIDRDFPDVIGETCRDVIAEEAASFQEDVAACLDKSTSKRAQELSRTYALSVGLTPPSQNEVAEPLDESEITMSEQSNVPNPANEDDISASLPTESTDEQVEQPKAKDQPLPQDSTEDLAIDSAEGFDDVEDALKAMESDLEELQALADGDLEAPATDVESAAPTDAELADQAQTVEPEAAAEVAEETFETDAIAESTPEVPTDDFQDSSNEEAKVPTETEVGDEATVPEAALPESNVVDATSEETAAVDSTEPADSVENDPKASIDGADDLDEADLAASLVAFNEAIAEIDEVSPAPEASIQANQQAAVNTAPDEAQAATASDRPTFQSQGPARRPMSQRTSTQRSRSSEVEMSIGNFADFLLNEVNGMWAEARQGLDDICTVRDEIQAIRAEVSRVHQEISTMRDSVMSARHDIRSVQSQIQNQRDDANRARQRADSAALDAQSACDRAAAAAREAESMATLSQPR
ncbi:MAG: hypothetical protein DHS20C16_20520 [Phycisphaerae bacterium]|nr:MAG: hypothetical protein DHS20C16_20520 [Phycisphaerae bacterium]